MNLSDLYRLEGLDGLSRVARRVSASPKYLYQCATGRRMPSPALGWLLVQAEPRLRFEDLYRHACRPLPTGDESAKDAA